MVSSRARCVHGKARVHAARSRWRLSARRRSMRLPGTTPASARCAAAAAAIARVIPVCPRCGGATRIIALITDGPTVRDILGHLGVPTAAPRIVPTRGHSGVRARRESPPQACRAAGCHRKWTIDSNDRRPHTAAPAIETAIRIRQAYRPRRSITFAARDGPVHARAPHCCLVRTRDARSPGNALRLTRGCRELDGRARRTIEMAGELKREVLRRLEVLPDERDKALAVVPFQQACRSTRVTSMGAGR